MRRRMWQARRGAVVLAVAAATVAVAGASVPAQADGRSAIGVRFAAGEAKPFAFPTDTPAESYLDRDGSFWFQQSAALYGKDDPRYWDFFTGTSFDDAHRDVATSEAVNPRNPKDRNDDTTWRCNTSPTGTESSFVRADVEAGTGYAQRNYCDLSGVWVDPDSGDWYGLVHNEFTPRPFDDGLHFDAIDVAHSSDRGRTWSITGHAITSPFSTKRGDTVAFPEDTYYYGDGDQRLLVDPASGYFYAWYGSRVVDKDGTWGAFEEHVARAPISQKMATGSWQKYANGRWESPGVGGTESNLVSVSATYPKGYVPAAASYDPRSAGTIAEQQSRGQLAPTSDLFVINVAWNAYLGMYIGTPETGGTKPLHFYGTKDLTTQRWVDLGGTPGYATSSWYRWMVDSATGTTGTIVGKTFRSYCSISCSDSDGEFVDVTTSSPAPAAPVDATRTYQLSSSGGPVLRQLPGGTLTTGAARPAASDTGWRFSAVGDGAYTVTNVGSGLTLGVATTSAQRAWGTVPRATALAAQPTVGQEWWVVPVTGTSTVRLVNRWSGLELSIGGGGGSPVATGPLRTWSSPRATADRRSPGSQRLVLTSVRAGA